MNSDILAVLLGFLVLLFIGSVAMSVFLLYDTKSGNYRRFLPAEEEKD